MFDILTYVEDSKSSEFYPTPQDLVDKMISNINFNYIHTILEPSAGKGDILRKIAEKEGIRDYIFDVDCIEIDENLQQILKYNFSDERKKKLTHQMRELEDKRKWNGTTKAYEGLNEQQKLEYQNLNLELMTFFDKGIHLVHNDFLTYDAYKQYDLIIMNPPFSNGDLHLLKAIKMQSHGGNIVCILNAETLQNPYTQTRKELLNELQKYDANIEYIQGAFRSAERPTGVTIALIKIHIEPIQEESDIYNRMKEAENYEEFNPDVTDIAVTDYIKAAVNRYKIEVKSGIELIRQYRNLVPYIQKDFKEDSEPILKLVNGRDRNYYNSVSINDYLKDVRLKYWRTLLANPKFVGKLTGKLQQEYREKIQQLAHYDFSEYNIYTLSTQMNASIKRGIEEEIVAMFERLTVAHSYYPECANNIHYYDGWKTNKAHKIGKKVIIPCYGVFSSYDGRPREYEARSTLEDIERILNFLDGNMTAPVDSWSFLRDNFSQGITKNICQKFYTVTFYKKGTVHITFTCPELIERFNIYVAQNKGWLPPSYGKKRYTEMDTDEKAVVDSFQGEEAYNKVLQKASYYFAPATDNSMLRLGE